MVKSGKVEIQNKAGLFGAYASGFLNDLFGIGAMLWPFLFGALGCAYLSARYYLHWWRWCGFFLLTICLLVGASALDLSIGDLAGGGMVGNTLYYNGAKYLSPFGSFLAWFFIFIIGLQLSWNFSWTSLCIWLSEHLKIKWKQRPNVQMPSKARTYFSNLADKVQSAFAYLRSKIDLQTFKDRLANFHKAKPLPELQVLQPEIADYSPVSREPEIIKGGILPEVEQSFVFREELPQETEITKEKPEERVEEIDPVIDEPVRTAPADQSPETIKLFRPRNDKVFPLPPTDLLVPPEPVNITTQENHREKGQALMACLNEFNTQGELVRITPGPIITRYEVRPASGVRVNRFELLSDDLSRAMKAESIRIKVPPGSDAVGIEIPNDTRELVNFRELLESKAFQDNKGSLPVILGKDPTGQPYMADLAKMPHLLVGGATGAGKSVSLNVMLISLLYRMQPKDLKLLLVDPKRVEMAVYSDLPHLIHPVVTEMSEAKTALEWAIHEMLNRFDTMKLLGVRNVADFNKKLADFKNKLPPDLANLQPIPYMVIVIDELADLILTARRDVESSICRLLQLARAAAIHLILATQRPSVDVVTGLLKANLNCRIAFRVSSKHDSNTILGEMGAERLLGRGDMLYKPNGGNTQRLHAPFLSDDEIQAVVNYWKQQEKPAYEINFSQWNGDSGVPQPTASGDSSADPLYAEAKAFVLTRDKISISLLQRELNIGFNRSAKMMEQLERDGIITAADGSKPRSVIH